MILHCPRPAAPGERETMSQVLGGTWRTVAASSHVRGGWGMASQLQDRRESSNLATAAASLPY
eukprot:2339874-Karenia_brevis.AAC.1